MRPILEDLLTRLRDAVGSPDASQAILNVLRASQQNRNAISDEIAGLDEDEVLLFEDDSCSIWTCRYDASVVLAPHEHCMPVHIAVYRGAEVQVLYACEPGRLRHLGNQSVAAGNILSLDDTAIHAVTAQIGQPSHAIHVYEGPLTGVQRDLFDWTTGERVPFTMEQFHGMKRRQSDMAEFAN